MTPNLIRLNGKLSDLYIEEGEADFVSSSNTQAVASSAAMGLALAGMAGTATNTLFAASGRADKVQYFTATLDGKRIAGRFSNIWFQNGDELEVAAQPQSDGTYAAYAIRRPSDKTLWMFPHCSRGSKAHWKFARKMSVILSVSFSVLLCMAPISFEGMAYFYSSDWLWSVLAIINGMVIGTYLSLNTARRWKPFIETAEMIFSTFGYSHPEAIDLPKQNKLYWKQHAKPNEVREVAPWVFRYLE